MYCQAAYICSVIQARIPHALAESPQTLDKTYEHVLQDIDWESAHRLLQLVVVASRPLRVEELASVAVVSAEAGSKTEAGHMS